MSIQTYIQEQGKIAVPIAFQKRYHLREGDAVALVETAQGFVVVPKRIQTAREHFFAKTDELRERVAESGLTDEQVETIIDEVVKEVRAEKAKPINRKL